MRQKTYILLGPPGAGKSTTAKILHNKLGLSHIEVGSKLRKVATEDSDFGKLVNEIIYEKKELVPDGIIGQLLDRELDTLHTGILLDGAPRRLSQIDEVTDALRKHDREIEKVIYLALPVEECVERISKRFLCENCKRAYKQGVDQEVASGICSKCGGKVAQRHDDTPEGVAKRYHVFEDETLPVIEHFRKLGLVIEVSALGDPDVIGEEILQSVQ